MKFSSVFGGNLGEGGERGKEEEKKKKRKEKGGGGHRRFLFVA